MAELRTNPGLYPGADGLFEFGEVNVRIADGGWRPGSWQELPPVVASEILRSADLLASVGTFAVINGPETGERLRLLSRLDQLPLHGQAQARRTALGRVFDDHPRGERLTLDDRHARIRTKLGTYAVHLSTGLVAGPDGAVLPPSPAVASVLTPVPWLPYDEPLFERIAAAIAELLDRP
jgi:hypothetical protein